MWKPVANFNSNNEELEALKEVSKKNIRITSLRMIQLQNWSFSENYTINCSLGVLKFQGFPFLIHPASSPAPLPLRIFLFMF